MVCASDCAMHALRHGITPSLRVMSLPLVCSRPCRKELCVARILQTTMAQDWGGGGGPQFLFNRLLSLQDEAGTPASIFERTDWRLRKPW